MTAEAPLDRTRRESLKEAVLNRRMLICVFTGFSSGLPLYLLFQMVPYWLRTEGVGLAEIGFFALVQFPYTWKFLWAPIMDRYTLPFLGHRRGWILLTQLALLFSIGSLGFLKPEFSLWTIAYLSAAVAFFSASQDVVLDAYRRELLPDVELGLGLDVTAAGVPDRPGLGGVDEGAERSTDPRGERLDQGRLQRWRQRLLYLRDALRFHRLHRHGCAGNLDHLRIDPAGRHHRRRRSHPLPRSCGR